MQFFLIKMHHNARNWKLYSVEHRQKQLRNAYYKITPNLATIWISVYKRQIYQIAESNRGKIDSVARIESNRNFFSPELECFNK